MTCVAAIDIGTNTTGLLVSDRDGHDLARIMTPTRLGFGVDTRLRFHPDALSRTLDCLRAYRSVIDRHSVRSIRCVATSASRLAADFPEFAQSAQEIIGCEVELIHGDEEGRLSYLGATSHVDVDPHSNLVIDIGGGSTELAVGSDRPHSVCSLEVGVVRLTERHLFADPPLPEELVNAIADVQDLVVDARREIPQLGSVTRVIGCSGTIIAIAAIEIGSQDVPNSFVLTRAAAEDVFRTLATESAADRIHNPGLDAHRVDIIVAGCCILVGIMRTLEIDAITISLGNILDGICLDLRSRL